MRRLHLIEFHDQQWFPRVLRDYVTDDLQIILNILPLYAPIAPRLKRALAESRADAVVDLCSGAGGPWPQLARVLRQQHAAPETIYLTDKYPNKEAFAQPSDGRDEAIHFRSEAVDATSIDPSLEGFRTIFNSFHHFPPREARGILQDAMEKQQGIGVFELPSRNMLTMLLLLFIPVADLLVVPLYHPFKWSRLLWTYFIPVVPFVLFFDGIVSCLRAYSTEELTEMTRGLDSGGYRWEVGVEKQKSGLLRLPVTYLIGCPANARRTTHAE
jgi:hypothetical protein